ncbi:MAG: YhcH/YjgK/YiaL family protein [Endomicrobium sp.]|jgi:YhcH/YjgK/YiaL family protein|uniref:YhcH/YjgK/YiaL family protein n=1 Tax=Candidatus Endomicrobiellum cubanum TaxID=3242325 RepID=UPI00281EAD7F|nr:YhcH/YjgK/YiaL family protein [Endomicrobium sp.]
MILDDLRNTDFYFSFNSTIKEALDFIKGNLSTFEEKRYDINEHMFAVVETSFPKPALEQKLETHKKYVDIQYVIEGCDIIGWKNLLNCRKLYRDYQLSRDIAFYDDKPDFNIVLNQGSFAVFFPQDAHVPLCSKLLVKKCIVKIAVEKLVSVLEDQK